jgi:hypothetical protein
LESRFGDVAVERSETFGHEATLPGARENGLAAWGRPV